MRNAFAAEITALAAADERVVLLSGDIGNRLFDEFKERAPDRFYNCGVAEANMIGVSSGLAMCGMRPVAYTIAPFITYRVIEQIRDDLCYHHLPVVLVGTGSGLRYASLGATHHSLEDVAMLRALPGMTVLAPADAAELRACLRDALALDGPVYVRIGKKGEPKLHAGDLDHAIGRTFVLREGKDACVLAAGVVATEALRAAELLARSGIDVRVVSVPTIKPLDAAFLTRVFGRFELIVTVEEHGLIGGFGASVAEWFVDEESLPSGRLLRIGTPDRFMHEAGETEYAQAVFGISAEAIADRIERRLGTKVPQVERPA
jgi:transketolase